MTQINGLQNISLFSQYLREPPEHLDNIFSCKVVQELQMIAMKEYFLTKDHYIAKLKIRKIFAIFFCLVMLSDALSRRKIA